MPPASDKSKPSSKPSGGGDGDKGAAIGGALKAAAKLMAKGGPVPGKGNKDTVAAKLTPGEFVVRKSAAKANAPALRSMNRVGPARLRRT